MLRTCLCKCKHVIHTKLLHLRCHGEGARMTDTLFAQLKVAPTVNWRNQPPHAAWTSPSAQYNITTLGP